MLISREARVGIVAGLATMTLAIAILFFHNVRSGKQEYQVNVILDDAGGIMDGADVYFAGVRVGTVRNVDIDKERNSARLTLGIQSDVELRSNYDFAVRSGALLGDRYVVIKPRKEERGVVVDTSGKEPIEVEGKGPLSVEELMPQVKDLMTNADALLKEFNVGVHEVSELTKDLRASSAGLQKMVNDPQTQAAIKNMVLNLERTSAAFQRLASSPQLQGTLANVNRATQPLEQITTNTNRLVKRTDDVMKSVDELAVFFKDVAKSNRENLDKTLATLPDMMKDLKDTISEFKRVVQTTGNEQNLEQINATLKSVRQVTENMAQVTQDVRQLTGDMKTQNDVKQLISTLNETAQSTKKTLEHLEATSANVRELTTDPQVKADLKDTIHETKKTMASANEALQEGKSLAEEGRQVMSRINKILGGGKRKSNKENKPSQPSQSSKASEGKSEEPPSSGGIFDTRIQPDLRMYQTPASNRYVSDLDFWISSGGRSRFVIGLHDVTESDKFTAQFAPALGTLGYGRMGIYRGKLGAGLDLLSGRARLSLNAYDPNNLAGNVWGGYRLFRNYELMLGVEGLGRSPRQVGVGVRVMK